MGTSASTIVYRLALDDGWGVTLQVAQVYRLHRPAPVQRLAQRVHYPAQQILAHGDAQPLAAGGHLIAALDALLGPQQDHVDEIVIQVEDHPLHASGKVDQFIGAGVGQAGEGRHAVADVLHGAHVVEAHGS
jgi:hypothetical protein